MLPDCKTIMERVASKSKHRKVRRRKRFSEDFGTGHTSGERSKTAKQLNELARLRMRRPVISYYCRCLVVSRIRVLVEKSCISAGRFRSGTSARATSRCPPAEPIA